MSRRRENSPVTRASGPAGRSWRGWDVKGTLVALCLVCIAGSSSGQTTRPSTQPGVGPDWPAFHGGGALTGDAQPIGPPPMRVRWTYRIDAEETVPIMGSAAIVGNAAYIADRRGTLHAIDLAVGSSRVDLQACKLEYSIVSPK